MTGAKHFGSLTPVDFDLHPLWCCVDWPQSEVASPMAPIENLEADRAYLAQVAYELRDGTKANGFCFIYDDSGFFLFDAGKALSVSTYVHCSTEEAKALSAALNRRVDEIFPIRYRGTVKVFGVLREGQITLQPNSALAGSNSMWRAST